MNVQELTSRHFPFLLSCVAVKGLMYILSESFSETQTCLLFFNETASYSLSLIFNLLILSSNITASLRHFFFHYNIPLCSLLQKECV